MKTLLTTLLAVTLLACSSSSSSGGAEKDAGGDVTSGDDGAAACPAPASIHNGGSCPADSPQACLSAETQVCCGATSGSGTSFSCNCVGGMWLCEGSCTAICDASTTPTDASAASDAPAGD